MAKGFSFEEALQPTVKGFSFEEALPPEPTLSPEEQVTSQVGQTSGTTAADLAKLTAAGAVKGTLGAPEAVQAGVSATARETAFAPTDILNLIADPRALTNKLVGAVGIPPVFEEKKFVPEKVTEKQKAAVDEVLTKGKIPQLRTLTEFGNRISADLENTISPEMKQALAESQPTGNILKALETGDFSEVSFGSKPTVLGLSGQAAKVFGSAFPAFLTAAVTKKAGPAAAVGFGQAGAEGVDEARSYIDKMTDDELTKKSEYFRNLVALGYTPREAREMTVNKAGDTAALYQGTVGALGGVFTNKLLHGAFDKTLLSSAKSRLGKILQGTALGAGEGGLSEMAEGVATDLGIDKAVVREIGVDSFANLVLGALGEGAPGTVRGAIAPTETPSKTSFTFEQAVAPEPTAPIAPAPVAAAPVVPPAAPPTAAPVTPIGAGEFEETPAVVTPEAPVTPAPEAAPVTAVTPSEKPTFDQWRTEQGLTFRSKEDYEAALPKLKAQYEAEISGAPAPKEQPKVKFAEDETGERLTYPMFADMAEKGYQLHSFEHPRTYENKGGVKYRTLEKDGVRIALEPQQLLFTNPKYPNREPQLGMGNENDVAFHFIGVDPELRKQGKAKKALQDLVDTADKNNYTLYGEPAQLEKEGMTKEQLTNLYAKYGFKPKDETGKVIVREPGAEVVQEPVQEPKQLAEKYYKPLTEYGWSGVETYGAGFPIVSKEKFVADHGESELKKLQDAGVVNVHPIEKGAQEDLVKRLGDYKDTFGDSGDFLWTTDLTISPDTHKTPEYQTNYQKYAGTPYTGEYEESNQEEYQAALEAQTKRKPTKEEKVAANKARQAEKKVAKKAEKPKQEIGIPLVKSRIEKNIPLNIVSSKDGKDWYATGQRVRDTDYLVKLDLTPEELKKAQEMELEMTDYMVGTEERTAMNHKLAALLTPAARRAVGMEEKPKTKAEVNKERQAEKKAKAEKPAKLSEALSGKDLVDMFVPEQYKKKAQEYVDAFNAYTKAWSDMEKIKDKNERQQFMNNVVGVKGLELDNIGRSLPPELWKLLNQGMGTKSLNEQQDIINAYEKASAPKKEAKKPSKKAEVKKPAKEEHIEGKKTEPVTSKTIEEAIDKAESNVNYNKIKTAVKNQFDQAIKRAKIQTEKEWAAATIDKNSYVTIDIPGDGKFKVKNNVERLKELQTKIANAVTPKAPKLPTGPSSGSLEAFKSMVDEKDMENAIEYAKLKGLDPKTVKLNPAQRTTVDKYLKNPAEFERQKEESEQMAEARATALRRDQEKRVAERLEADEKREEEARFKAVLDTTIRSTEAQLKSDIKSRKISSADATRMLEVIPGLPTGTVKPYVIKELESKKKKPPEEGEFYNTFDTDFTKADLDSSIEMVRDDKISELATTSRRITATMKKVANQGSDLELQARLNYLMEYKQQLKNELEADKPERRSAEWFRARAAEELAKENIKPETMAVVDKLYKKYPTILEGLKLSVRQPQQRGVTGNYRPIERLVTVYHSSFANLLTGQAGKKQAATMRHEITHSLEQMMPETAQKALVDAWADSLEKAIKAYPGKPEQDYFQAVLDFTEKPNESNYRKAVSLMPDYKFYQYMNPSEYWAVNAEKLMKATLGSPWSRFVKGVQKLWEAIKSVFGFDNRYAVHREFDRIMAGDQQQMTQTMLADYLRQNKEELTFLNSVEKVDELLEKHKRPDTPLHPSGEVKDTILGSYQKSKKIATKMAENPLMTAVNMVGKADRAITYARNKNVWYGSGLEQADFAKYNGQLRNSQGLAAASVAVTNAIHAGHVGTQVMVQGKLMFDPKTQMFRAEKDKNSLANVVRLKHDLEEKLGAQRASNVINAYFEAKRSRSIVNEYLNRSADYEAAIESGEDPEEAAKNLKSIEIAIQKVNMDDEAIDDFIALEKDYPELRKMMDNWTAVNKNMLDMMEFSGVISKKRAEHLRGIKDYVPWYRIMDEQTDIHMPLGVRGMTNVGQEKKFKAGEVDRDIDDIVDNMIHNVMMMTRNSMRNYANNRIAMEYATRNEKGKIKLYPTEGKDENGVRVNMIANGRRVVVNIPDPLIAEASLGMENIEIPMIDILSFFAQGLRRGITTNPAFQVAQLFMDAPTAAWVSGVKNPAAVWAGTFGSFIRALKPHDPIVDMLKSYGIGGYQSSARTPEKEMKLEIGLIDKSVWARTMKTLDHIGDASDYSQRRAVYKQVLKETGDEMQALIQANNVIDFLKRGSGKGAQFVTRTVSFMNAYAQSIDVLAQALAGGGLKGKTRNQARAQMLKTGLLLAGTTLLYCMAVGADDEYNKLDDQTKIRNIIIPGTKIRLPMHTSASFFFKSIPELIYNKVMKEGTKNQVDWTRLKTALGKAAADSLLGPNMIPTGVKPIAEIALNHNFFTGGTVTPRGMEKLESFRQYNNSTSELGKVLSALTGGVLNPIEMDHLVRGLFGTAGAAVMYGSNLFSGDRVSPQAKDNPLYGSFVLPEVPRGREDLFYDLKERSDKKYETFLDMMKKQHPKEAQEYRAENKGLIAAHGFVTGADADLKRINAEIRRLSDLPADKMSSEEKRARITKFQEQKNRILEKTIEFRLRAEL